MFRLGLQLRSLRMPLRQALKKASELGADAIEFDLRNELRPEDMSITGIRHLKKQMADWNLKICAASYPTRRGYDNPDDLDRRIDGTKRAMKLAYQLGAPLLVNHIGTVPEDPTSPRFIQLKEALLDLGNFGHTTGAVLAAKTGSEDGVDLARMLNELPDGLLAVDFDPGAMIINGFSAEDSFKALHQHIRHVRGKDGVRDLARGRGLEVPLGRGTVDFPLLLALLDDMRYSGYLTVEREHPEHPEEELGNALAYLREIQSP
ncbi:MAG: sugar phosphate isomerase/epimerase family protein [Pirellulaceae bacterium]